MTYGGFKYLPKRKASDEVLHDKVFNIAKNAKYNKYEPRLATMI